MKLILAALFTTLSLAAHAASPEETYLAARDAYIAKFNPSKDPSSVSDALAKEEEGARADLTRQLRAIVGPLNVSGYAGDGEFAIATLFRGDIGFGTLDGLTFSAPKDANLVVTTRGLLERWVRDHKDWWNASVANVPQDPIAALQTEAFYTQAISADAAVARFAEFPISKPANADVAYAMLVMRRQDIGPGSPDEVLVGVLSGARLYIVSVPASAEIKLMPACEKLWDDALAKSNKLLESNATSGNKDEKLFDEQNRMQDQGDAAMRQCFAERVTSDAAFAKLTKQAQEVVDQLAK
jgi:hypothetical protein